MSVVASNLARNALRLLLPAVIVALLTGAASAQITIGSGSNGGSPMPGLSLGNDNGKRKLTPEEQQKQDELDQAYKAATRKIPDQKPGDPWATVRPSAPTPAPKTKQQ